MIESRTNKDKSSRLHTQTISDSSHLHHHLTLSLSHQKSVKMFNKKIEKRFVEYIRLTISDSSQLHHLHTLSLSHQISVQTFYKQRLKWWQDFMNWYNWQSSFLVLTLIAKPFLSSGVCRTLEMDSMEQTSFWLI